MNEENKNLRELESVASTTIPLRVAVLATKSLEGTEPAYYTKTASGG